MSTGKIVLNVVSISLKSQIWVGKSHIVNHGESKKLTSFLYTFFCFFFSIPSKYGMYVSRQGGGGAVKWLAMEWYFGCLCSISWMEALYLFPSHKSSKLFLLQKIAESGWKSTQDQWMNRHWGVVKEYGKY